MFETIFKALGEPTRLKIIKLLADKELCVCDLEEVMQISQPRISQHLKVLKHAGLVNERKEGQRSICSLSSRKATSFPSPARLQSRKAARWTPMW